MKKTILICFIVAITMFGFSFALAPLYNTFCKLTGIPRSLTEKEFFAKINVERDVTVQLTTVNNNQLPWDFYPLKTNVHVHPGVNTQVLFFIKNNTNHTMTVQAIPSISPTSAIQYFHKIQCFCFTQQTLNAGQSANMAVVFNVDNSLPKEIGVITLGYSLFNVTQSDREHG